MLFAIFLIARPHKRRSANPTPTGFILQIEQKTGGRVGLHMILGKSVVG